MLRAAIAAESADIPSVSIVCEGFEGQARATARGHGYDGLPLAVTVGHVDAQSADEMTRNFVERTVDDVIAGLTSDTSHDDHVSDEPAALDIVATGTVDDIQAAFLEHGWSDGHPVVPPTRSRVEAYLADSGHDPWKTLGTATSSGRDVTIWSIAVNAVMAGCRPEHLPVLIALAEILVDPAYGAQHSGNTTGADALIVLDGPHAAALGFRHGAGVMREGAHANTAVGRWLRLYLRNVFGFTADEHDKATFGNPTRTVLAEDRDCLAEIGWPAISGAFGFGPDEDVVTMARMNSGTIIGSVFGSTPDEIVPYLADGLVRATSWDLTHLHGIGDDQYQPLLVLSPILARTFARAGWTKADAQQALFRHARIPARRFERYIGEWSNLTPGRRRLGDLVADGSLPPVFAESDDQERFVPIVTRPDRIMIAVAGDPNRTNAYAFSNDGPHGWWTARVIDHTPASDLVCRIGGEDCGPARPDR
ncbi:MAG TPA: UGSC family (seleno)protein [Ilumatobacter sp.]|nr:UGSC family (seleno)protein [Ilumatobacter sp.]